MRRTIFYRRWLGSKTATTGSFLKKRHQYHRLAAGFMGQQWDGGDIAFRPETWATVAAVLRPGAFLVAFGGTRTFHRLVCAIEDAGFVVQDQIAWMFGSGFPKRRDMLKPAFEPICLAYKPGGKRTMQVDECRIGVDGGTKGATAGPSKGILGDGLNGAFGIPIPGLGRWPANIVHDGSDEVLAGFPESTSTAASRLKPEPNYQNQIYGRGMGGVVSSQNQHTDTGSAARFFYTAKADKQNRWAAAIRP